MMRSQNNAFMFSSVGKDAFGQPFYILIPQSILNEPLHRVISCVKPDDKPVVVFQTKEARFLLCIFPILYNSEVRQKRIEIGESAREHFMIAEHGKTSFFPARPGNHIMSRIKRAIMIHFVL